MDRLAIEYFGTAPTAIQIILLLSFSFVAAKAIDVIGYYVLHRSQRLATREYDRIIIEELHVPLYITVFLAGYTQAHNSSASSESGRVSRVGR